MTDTPHPVSDLAQRPWMSAILIGLLAVILGVAALARPGPSSSSPKNSPDPPTTFSRQAVAGDPVGYDRARPPGMNPPRAQRRRVEARYGGP